MARRNSDTLINWPVTATLVWYYAICRRECWLISHQIVANQENDFLALGRLNTEIHYKRDDKEISLPGGVRVDRVRREKGKLILSEVKKTSKFLPAARLQLAYYLLLLEQDNVFASGEILVPDERFRETVELEDLRDELLEAVSEIENLIEEPFPPSAKWIRYCKTCAYAEFCWAG